MTLCIFISEACTSNQQSKDRKKRAIVCQHGHSICCVLFVLAPIYLVDPLLEPMLFLNLFCHASREPNHGGISPCGDCIFKPCSVSSSTATTCPDNDAACRHLRPFAQKCTHKSMGVLQRTPFVRYSLAHQKMSPSF